MKPIKRTVDIDMVDAFEDLDGDQKKQFYEETELTPPEKLLEAVINRMPDPRNRKKTDNYTRGELEDLVEALVASGIIEGKDLFENYWDSFSEEEQTTFLEAFDLFKREDSIATVMEQIKHRNRPREINNLDIQPLLLLLTEEGLVNQPADLEEMDLLEVWDAAIGARKLQFLRECGGFEFEQLKAVWGSTGPVECNEFVEYLIKQPGFQTAPLITRHPALIKEPLANADNEKTSMSYDQLIDVLTQFKQENPRTLMMIIESLGYKLEKAL